MDAGARAVFAGITLETTPADLYRSIMEGVAYEMKVNLERLSTYGICPNMLFATGGGAKSQVWLQMKADILGLPITAIDAPEVGTLGTVMLAAVAVGMVSDLQGAKALFVKEGKTFYPDSGKGDAYRELYEKYVQIYTAAKNWR
ncbi:MAG: FGGY-family carbohydrate kinase [Clostridia bacterium]